MQCASFVCFQFFEHQEHSCGIHRCHVYQLQRSHKGQGVHLNLHSDTLDEAYEKY